MREIREDLKFRIVCEDDLIYIYFDGTVTVDGVHYEPTSPWGGGIFLLDDGGVWCVGAPRIVRKDGRVYEGIAPLPDNAARETFFRPTFPSLYHPPKQEMAEVIVKACRGALLAWIAILAG